VQSKKPDWWVKIGDFGISKRAEEGLTAFRTFSGTYGFIAPEILAQDGLLDDSDFRIKGEYTVAVDIWSLGEISFRALTGEQPFPIRSLKTYVKGSSPFPIEMLQTHNVSDEGCNFLISLMAPMPEDRLTARNALSHIWAKSQNQSTIVSAEIQRYLLGNQNNLSE
jgi:serine/threonine protein kinase